MRGQTLVSYSLVFNEPDCIVNVSPHDFDGGFNIRIGLVSEQTHTELSLSPACLREIIEKAEEYLKNA